MLSVWKAEINLQGTDCFCEGLMWQIGGLGHLNCASLSVLSISWVFHLHRYNRREWQILLLSGHHNCSYKSKRDYKWKESHVELQLFSVKNALSCVKQSLSGNPTMLKSSDIFCKDKSLPEATKQFVVRFLSPPCPTHKTERSSWLFHTHPPFILSFPFWSLQ